MHKCVIYWLKTSRKYKNKDISFIKDCFSGTVRRSLISDSDKRTLNYFEGRVVRKILNDRTWDLDFLDYCEYIFAIYDAIFWKHCHQLMKWNIQELFFPCKNHFTSRNEYFECTVPLNNICFHGGRIIQTFNNKNKHNANRWKQCATSVAVRSDRDEKILAVETQSYSARKHSDIPRCWAPFTNRRISNAFRKTMLAILVAWKLRIET